MSKRRNRSTRLNGFERLEDRAVPASHLWNDLGATNNWSDAGNWTGGIPTNGEVGGTIVVIPINDATCNQDIAGLVLNKLQFTNAGSSTITLNKALTISGDIITNNVVNSSGANKITGAFDLQLGGTSTPFFDMAGGSLTVVSNITGPKNLILNSGGGVLELQGANTYTGETHVNQGILRLNNAGSNLAIPATPLLIGNNDTGVAEAFVQLVQGSEIPTGTDISVGTDGVFALLGNSEVVGNISMLGGQIATGGGALTVDGNLSVFGDATIQTGGAGNDGTVILTSGDHTINVASGKTLTVQTRIAGNGNVVKTGTGNLLYSNKIVGLPNTYTGSTKVKDGGLILDDIAANSAFLGSLEIGDGVGAAGSAFVRLNAQHEIPNATAIDIRGDGLLDLNGKNETLGNLTMALDAAVVTGAGTLFLEGNVTMGLVFSGTNSASITGNLDLSAGDHVFTTFDNSGVASDFVIDGVISGLGGFKKSGIGTLEIRGTAGTPNTFAGGAAVLNGTLLLNDSGINEAIPGQLTIGDGIGANGTAIVQLAQSTEISDGSGVTIFSDGTLDLNGKNDAIGGMNFIGGLAKTGIGSLLINGDIIVSDSPTTAVISGKLGLNGATRFITVADGAAATDFQIDAVVSNGGLLKKGPGHMVLTGNNTYAGPTMIDAGTLTVTGANPSAAVSLNGGTLAGSGTVGTISSIGGKIAPKPGLTPLSASATALNGATFVESILGSSTYSRLSVTGTVNLTGSTLDATLGFASATGNQFTVIDNDLADAVVGTFNGMPEGTTLVRNGRTLKISYVGGTGNDVVLTDVTSVPVVPPAVPPAVPPSVPPSVPPAVPTSQSVLVGGLANGSARVFNPTNGQFQPDSTPTFFPGTALTVRTATADVTGDGVADFIGATGPGGVSGITVIDGKTGNTLASFQPFESSFTGGLYVAAADLDGDGRAEVVVTPDQGGGPIVAIYRGSQLAAGIGGEAAQLVRFSGIEDPAFRGGARVALGDVNGDGTTDLVVAAGFGGGPRMAIFNGKDVSAGSPTPKKLVPDFFAYEADLRNGAFVAAGDINGDGAAELAFGGGPGGAPRVRVFDGRSLLKAGAFGNVDEIAGKAQLANFFAGGDTPRGGVRLSLKDANGDGKADLVAGSGEGELSRVRTYDSQKVLSGDANPSQEIDPFGGVLLNGVFVG